mmetsp:Transcript_15450/g.41827  ORF Transcript_15450/g.41827 Transcript_15450/m.41827 type:complete len:202 (-) Transcript_15450:1575-2180(-)
MLAASADMRLRRPDFVSVWSAGRNMREWVSALWLLCPASAISTSEEQPWAAWLLLLSKDAKPSMPCVKLLLEMAFWNWNPPGIDFSPGMGRSEAWGKGARDGSPFKGSNLPFRRKGSCTCCCPGCWHRFCCSCMSSSCCCCCCCMALMPCTPDMLTPLPTSNGATPLNSIGKPESGLRGSSFIAGAEGCVLAPLLLRCALR